jgi:AraC-like DNA-binding protein
MIFGMRQSIELSIDAAAHEASAEGDARPGIASLFGRESRGEFGNAFRRVTGETPAAWRRERLS